MVDLNTLYTKQQVLGNDKGFHERVAKNMEPGNQIRITRKTKKL